MSFSIHNIISFKNNQALRKRRSYFNNQKETIKRSQRTQTGFNTFNPIKDAYELSLQRRRLMFKKGIRLVIIFFLSIIFIALGTIWLLG